MAWNVTPTVRLCQSRMRRAQRAQRAGLVVYLLVLLSMLAMSAMSGAAVRTQATEALRWPLVQQVQNALFEGYAAILDNRPADAASAANKALSLYTSGLDAEYAQSDVQLSQRLLGAIQEAERAAKGGDPVRYGGYRGLAHVALFQGTFYTFLRKLEMGSQDHDDLINWLNIREVDTQTAQTRPLMNSIDSLSKYLRREANADALRLVATADLLDTYQVRMRKALIAADDNASKGLTSVWAEEAGAALGYFHILAGAYADQYGQAAQEAALLDFNGLFEAVLTGDTARYARHREAISQHLEYFVAAPLTAPERPIRAGQFLRYVGLASFEYQIAFDPASGAVLNENNFSETLLAHRRAWEAYIQLRPAFTGVDADTTERIGADLRRFSEQVRARAHHTEVSATATQIITTTHTLMPTEWYTVTTRDDIRAIRAAVQGIRTSVESGLYGKALQGCGSAYAALDAGLEQRLLTFAPQIGLRLDSLLWTGEPDRPGLAVLIAARAPAEQIALTVDRVNAALDEAEAIFNLRYQPTTVIVNAGVITFREGLEAVLILAALAASFRLRDAVQRRRMGRAVLAGALVALVISIGVWWLAYRALLLLPVPNEVAEVGISIIAIITLLIITNWFFHKVYWTRWLAGWHQAKRQVLAPVPAEAGGTVTGSVLIGLAALGFFSVLREGFETALMVQAMTLNAGWEPVLVGLGIGLAGVLLLGGAVLMLGARLPHRRLLILTGVLMGMVLLVMVGTTVRQMQLLGWLPTTPLGSLTLPLWVGQWFGVFATVQGLAAQSVAALVVVGSYWFAARMAVLAVQQQARRVTQVS